MLGQTNGPFLVGFNIDHMPADWARFERSLWMSRSPRKSKVAESLPHFIGPKRDAVVILNGVLSWFRVVPCGSGGCQQKKKMSCQNKEGHELSWVFLTNQ
jgi:hypothetical protein